MKIKLPFVKIYTGKDERKQQAKIDKEIRQGKRGVWGVLTWKR